jgi:hypothetical protein
MDVGVSAGLFGAIGTVAFFAFVSFACWVDYQKKREERDAVRQERLKALELGHPPLDAEIERARAYASAAWAAGLIGLLVPLGVVSLMFAATVVTLSIRKSGDDPGIALLIAWGISGVIMLVTILRSLSVIRQLPAPTAVAQQRPEPREKRVETSAQFQEMPRGH